jgi:rhodanese-related sulfurtransferase
MKVLKAEGFTNVYELKDGLVTWLKEDLPLDTKVLE